MPTTILSQNAANIGGDTATSAVPTDYEGSCAVVEASGSERVVAVLPSVGEAYRVAKYSITPDGGYGSVVVEPTSLPVTHSDLEGWV